MWVYGIYSVDIQKENKLSKYSDYSQSPKGWTARLIARIKHRSSKKNIDYDLDLAWFRDKLQDMKCEVTGIQFPLDFWVEGKRKAFSPSIDRIDPKKGYTKDNCQVVCWIYNAAKQEFTHADIEKLSSAVLSLKE